jgi:hypothetical protein
MFRELSIDESRVTWDEYINTSRLIRPYLKLSQRIPAVYRKMSAVDVIETTLGTGPEAKPRLVFRFVERCLRAIIPAANPDFERSYVKVCKWWVEIDSAGTPQRELGLNERGEVIVASPIGKNFGFFTDSNAVFAVADHPVVEHPLFEAAWHSFEDRWARGIGKGYRLRDEDPAATDTH